MRFRYSDATIAVTKEMRLGTGYLFDVQVTVVGPAYDVLVGPGLRNPTERRAGLALRDAGLGRRRDRRRPRRSCDPDKAHGRRPGRSRPKGFAGIEDNYFLAVLLPRGRRRRALFTFRCRAPTASRSLEVAAGRRAARARSTAPRSSARRT